MVLVLGLAVLLASACQRPASTSGCTGISIDWVDFIQVGSTEYVAGTEGTPAVADADLGGVFARVKFKVDGNVCDPQYRLKDGDAAFLEPGTSIYSVTGHPTDRLLAARREGRLIAYAAISPP